MEPRRLGHGCEGVEAIELVTSEAKLIRASKTENQEYFWAARGAGSGFSASSRATISSCKPFPRRCMGAAIFIPSRKPPPSRRGWSGSPGVSRPASSSVRTVRRKSLTKPVRGVQSLSTRCALCAEFPIVGGMLGVSLRFHDPAARDMQKHSASHPTIGADSPGHGSFRPSYSLRYPHSDITRQAI